MAHRRQASFDKRRSLRLKGYDYAQAGAYFITVCTVERACILGEILNGEVSLSRNGRIVSECWNRLPDHFTDIELDASVVMPNHVHGIIVLSGDDTVAQTARRGEALLRPPAPKRGPDPNSTAPSKRRPHGTRSGSLGAIIQNLKSYTTRQINATAPSGGGIWQRNYHDHIIRNEAELHLLRDYIETNPLRWELDSLYCGDRSSSSKRHG